MILIISAYLIIWFVDMTKHYKLYSAVEKSTYNKQKTIKALGRGEEALYKIKEMYDYTFTLDEVRSILSNDVLYDEFVNTMIVLLVEADTKEEYIEKWDKFREEVKEKI
jgi:hypothetical protein